jgi:hypothetical protein
MSVLKIKYACMEYKKEKNGFTLIFKGKRTPREKLLNEFDTIAFLFFSKTFAGSHMPLLLIVFFREMVKNIYDHANGRGSMKIKKNEKKKIVSFDVLNESNNDSETEKKEWVKKSPNNFGIGLKMITGTAEDPLIHLEKNGYHYWGEIQIKTPLT